MSFSMTEDRIRDRSKRVTRRLGWLNAKAGEEVRAVRKVMGRKKGEPIEDLARIRLVSVRREQLLHITKREVELEGYPEMQPWEFIEKFCEAMTCSPRTRVTRIEFEYLEPAP